MLKIRAEQLTILENKQREAVASRYGHTLKAKYVRAFQYYTERQMTHWTLKQLNHLKAHQIETSYAVEGILALFALFGEPFERSDEPH